VIVALQGCVMVALQGCVMVALQGCVIVALQACVIADDAQTLALITSNSLYLQKTLFLEVTFFC
jgi:hypothetical protein